MRDYFINGLFPRAKSCFARHAIDVRRLCDSHSDPLRRDLAERIAKFARVGDNVRRP
jgi:hypothetical protein